MAKLSKRKWYERVNAAWPEQLPELTAIEAVRAGRKLYRFMNGKTFPAAQVRLTSGQRYSDIRRSTMFINPTGHTRGSRRGWEALVHDLSHVFYRGKHSGTHARVEIMMIKEVIKRGWLDGGLKEKTLVIDPAQWTPEVVARDVRALKIERAKAAIVRWERKEKRAQNALKKLHRSLGALVRAASKPATPPKPRVRVLSTKQKAEALAHQHGVEIEVDVIERGNRHIWVTCEKLDGDADPYDGDHIVYDWTEALDRVKGYAAALTTGGT